MGRGRLELAQTLLRVALAWHNAGSSTPKDLRVNEPKLTSGSGGVSLVGASLVAAFAC